ncbi:LysR family transcriptional regulator [Streptomyces sp. NBC_01803]|uniref:LysR family transcriptional regulator n=1 Tax=Streptomyces sp. NBC_01803 TaxID=2975946 RepID=UPI002DD97561|nr:LysR family transcriptional regulator [Streptomyces sp. NBC_01803]WSA47286.1 LysR family transcriptional regulator [Streptomyces sp. NBC_01803]
MLDVRKLVLLREVGVRGSIAAAAQALNYTRSAVSQQLSALEVETGVPLLDRSNRRAGLTAEGRLLVAHSERILAQMEEAESDLLAANGQVAGELRVGVPFHDGPPVLMSALTQVRAAHPQLRITMRGVSSGEGRQAVHLGQLDLAMATRYDRVPEPQVPGLHEEPLISDRVRLAVAADHPLAGATPQPLARFAGEQFILRPGSALGRLTLHLCAEAGFTPDVVADSDDMQAVLAFVALGWGVALIPDLVPDRPGFPVVRLPLTGATPTRHVSLVVRHTTLTCPSIARVLPMIRQAADELSLRANGARERLLAAHDQ